MVTVVITNRESVEVAYALSELCNKALNTRKNYRFSCQQVLEAISKCFYGKDRDIMNDLYNFDGNGEKDSTYTNLSQKYGYSIDDLAQIESIKLIQLKKYLKKQPQCCD